MRAESRMVALDRLPRSGQTFGAPRGHAEATAASSRRPVQLPQSTALRSIPVISDLRRPVIAITFTNSCRCGRQA